MKKMIFSLLAIAAMTSCTTTSEDEIDPNAPVEIKLSAGIGNVEAIGRATIPSTLTTDLDVFFARAADASDADVNWTTGTTELFAKINHSDSKISFYAEAERTTLAPQYYNFNADLKSHLIGYHVGEATKGNLADNKIAITITGKDDIMATKALSGNKSTKFTEFAFSHLLSQLSIEIQSVSETLETSIQSTFGKITSIEILNQPTALELTLGATPTLGKAASPVPTTFTITPTTVEQTITATATTVGSEVMVFSDTELGKTANPIKLKIYTTIFTSGLAIDATIDGGNSGLELGKKHIITLTFSLSEVKPSASIDTWAESTKTGTGTVE